MRFPLYTRIILWFFLNLLLVAAGLYLFFRFQFQVGLDSLLMGQAGERVRAVSQVITGELNASPSTAWTNVLQRFSRAYNTRFSLFGTDGRQIAGEPIVLPATVLAKVTQKGESSAQAGRGFRQGRGTGRGPPPGRGPYWLRESITNTAAPGWGRTSSSDVSYADSNPQFAMQTSDPTRYWAGMPLTFDNPDHRRSGPAMLLAMSPSLHGSGLFLDFRPWAVVGLSVLLFSMLFWFPLVRSISRSISRLTQATEQIAEGQFDIAIPIKRRDELGRLGQGINRMAARLASYVTGQKRFLGDIAHELCSPIARIQVALGILEQRADEKQKAYVADVREEVEQMSGLVNELLAFSKAGLQPKEIKLQPVSLVAIVRRVLERESLEKPSVEVSIDESFRVMAEPELLTRAVANVVRNARRYAGTSGPISITAAAQDNRVSLSIADTGPGVPPDALDHLFDPFFRVEPSRSRTTGGVGLGLAIVKTCVEACQGTVRASHHHPHGLQIDFSLRNALSQEKR